MEEEDDDYLPPAKSDAISRVRKQHDVYLKAVHNPTRRRILELISNQTFKVEKICKILLEEEILRDDSSLDYHLNMLKNARCIELCIDKDSGEELIEITQEGKVVDYLEK